MRLTVYVNRSPAHELARLLIIPLVFVAMNQKSTRNKKRTKKKNQGEKENKKNPKEG